MTTFSLPNVEHTLMASQRASQRTAALFNAALAAGRQRRWWLALLRRPHGLRRLAADAARVTGGRHAGLKLVEIADIRGSEGRTTDFDYAFNPLTSTTRQRWQRVADAFDDGLRLPPVTLIQVGRHYFVRDGHHRISVLRALGQAVVEAEVTEWGSGQAG